MNEAPDPANILLLLEEVSFFSLPSLVLLSHPYCSMLGASLVSSPFLLGLGIDVALPAMLFLCKGLVAECYPRSQDWFM